jgi:RNA polymerase sigma factor (sigma-70 family)
MSDADHITRILIDLDAEKPGAMDDLMTAVYSDLERVAHRHLAERYGPNLTGVTLEPAALVNESFLTLIKQRKAYANREQFFAIATRIMLRVLVDYQRRKLAAKRGGNIDHVTLSLDVCPEIAKDPTTFATAVGSVSRIATASSTGSVERTISVKTLIDSLDCLDELDRRKADVVRLRVVWGLEMKEIAQSLEVSLATVERDWAFAKAWLAREAADQNDDHTSAPTASSR